MTYPNEMPPQRDRYILIPVFILAPALLLWAVILPAQHRMAGSRARMDAANAQLETISHVAPLTSEERRVLDDPEAPWRRRIPVLADDADKLRQYAEVITGLQTQLRAQGGDLEGVRSSWDPIRADFSAPGRLMTAGPSTPAVLNPDATVAGWALEVRIAQPPQSLGRALACLPRVEPLLIPAGLRWEARDGHVFQALILRDLYLAPQTPSPQTPTPQG